MVKLSAERREKVSIPIEMTAITFATMSESDSFPVASFLCCTTQHQVAEHVLATLLPITLHTCPAIYFMCLQLSCCSLFCKSLRMKYFAGTQKFSANPQDGNRYALLVTKYVRELLLQSRKLMQRIINRYYGQHRR